MAQVYGRTVRTMSRLWNGLKEKVTGEYKNVNLCSGIPCLGKMWQVIWVMRYMRWDTSGLSAKLQSENESVQ